MTALIEYNRLPTGEWEAQRIVVDCMYLEITERAGNMVVVTPDGETIAHVDDLGEEFKVYGEVRFST